MNYWREIICLQCLVRGGINVLELLIGNISILQCLLHSMTVKEIDYQGLLDREERKRVYENKLKEKISG